MINVEFCRSTTRVRSEIFEILKFVKIFCLQPERSCNVKRNKVYFPPQDWIYFVSFLFFISVLIPLTDTNKNTRRKGSCRWFAECLDDADLVGDVKSVVIASQTHISLLLAVGSDETVHLRHFDVVELANGGANVILVGAEMNLEHQSVVVLDLLHGGLSRQRILDDVECIHAVAGWNGLSRILGIARQSECSRAAEANCGADLAETSSEWSLNSLRIRRIISHGFSFISLVADEILSVKLTSMIRFSFHGLIKEIPN